MVETYGRRDEGAPLPYVDDDQLLRGHVTALRPTKRMRRIF